MSKEDFFFEKNKVLKINRVFKQFHETAQILYVPGHIRKPPGLRRADLCQNLSNAFVLWIYWAG